MMNEFQRLSSFKDLSGHWAIPSSRSYFDCFSSQFNTHDWCQKLDTLGFLIHEGMDLPEIIMGYCDCHSPIVVAAVKPTLEGYIQWMRWGDPQHVTTWFLDALTEVELAALLQDELRVRYQWDGVNCSHWDDTILDELVRRAESDHTKFAAWITSADLSREFQDRNHI